MHKSCREIMTVNEFSVLINTINSNQGEVDAKQRTKKYNIKSQSEVTSRDWQFQIIEHTY